MLKPNSIAKNLFMVKTYIRFFSQQNSANAATSAAATTTQTDVNKTSGGITIVKLNAAPPPVPMHSSQSRPKLHQTNGLTNHQETTPPVAPPRPTTPSQIGHHVVTIHTSSVTTTAAAAAAAAAGATNNNSMPLSAAAAAPPPPQHTGYTRRAKLGDSRSTGRLHSAGNTHRSMTRLNIAGTVGCGLCLAFP